MDGETKRNWKALGTWAIMIGLGVVVVVLMVGCKSRRQMDFEQACKAKGGTVVYEETNHGRTVYIKCRDKDGRITTW